MERSIKRLSGQVRHIHKQITARTPARVVTLRQALQNLVERRFRRLRPCFAERKRAAASLPRNRLKQNPSTGPIADAGHPGRKDVPGYLQG
jgi:hypothetical protein